MKLKLEPTLFQLLFAIAIVSTWLPPASAAIRCSETQRTRNKIESTASEDRMKILERNELPTLSSLLKELISNGNLIYKGPLDFESGTEFLASNEGDWTNTPFDHRPTDLVIAFGTNSAWEVAVNKKTRDLVIGDWSPYPLFAQAYLVEPMMRISNTPAEFLLNMAGLIPEPHLRSRSIDGAFEAVHALHLMSPAKRMERVERFLHHLAENPKISNSELKFLTSYFYAMAGNNPSPLGMGPFHLLESATRADLLHFYQMRYGTEELIKSTGEGSLEVSKKYGALLSQANFNYLKNLYDTGHVRLALTSITDPQFYAKIAQDYSAKSLPSITLSITNIFDCGSYNGLTFQDLQRYLQSTFQSMGRSNSQPLTVFRTANNRLPHGFYRYDMKSPQDIPKKDEEDSSALQESPNSPRASGQ